MSPDIEERKSTVLIVEDDESNFLLLKLHILELNDNIKILHALDGDIGVEMVKEHPEIDLVLMDINMPVMDGHEATKLISEIRPHLPIVYQTAYTFEDNFLEAATSGGSNFITKPIDIDTLSLVLSRYLT